MSNIYRCDRCGCISPDEKGMQKITVEMPDTNFVSFPPIIYHYCDFCMLIVNNALAITNNGTYTGSLNGNDKINCAMSKDRKLYDPLSDKQWFKVGGKEYDTVRVWKEEKE